MPAGELASWVAATEAEDGPGGSCARPPRYALLLREGVRIGRSHDLVLCHAILRDTATVPAPLPPSAAWEPRQPADATPSLFDVFDEESGSRRPSRPWSSTARNAG